MKFRQCKGCRVSGFETLEDRRVLAASLGWDGPGLGSAELTYHIANAPPTLSQAQVDAAVETAFGAWEEAADITFERVDTPGLRNSIDISFIPLDGSGGTLAQAYFPDDLNSPIVAGDIQFDIAERWEVGNALGSRAFDLVSVAVHEIGHSLGLGHDHDHEDSILAPTISPNEFFVGLSDSDVAAIQSLYAPALPLENDVLPTDDTPETDPVDQVSTSSIEDRIRQFAERFRRWSTRRFDGSASFGGGVIVVFQPSNSMHNHVHPRDVNGDESVSPIDVLLIINTINSGDHSSDHQCDTDNDGSITPMDALMVVNELNSAADTASDGQRDGADDSVDGVTREGDGTAANEENTGEDETSENPAEDDNQMELDHERGTLVGRLQRIATELFPVVDTSDDGLLTQEGVPDVLWQRLLVYGLDANGDDAISLDEIHERIAALRLDVFRAQDIDDSGELTEDELGTARWNRLQTADTDASGGISFEEFEDFRTQSRFDRFDADMSGGLSEAELGESRWNRLERFDEDRSGELTEDELPRLWERAGRPAPWLRFARMALRFTAMRRFFS